jgi:hypothetical protein
MLITVISIAGGGLAVFGLLIMRDPMRLSILGAGAAGYYQRMVLDTRHRRQLRMLGMVMSFFGLMILTAALQSRLKVRVLNNMSDGFLALLWLSFLAAFGFGLVDMVVRLTRGEGTRAVFDSWRIWKQGIELGPINVAPAITPKMRKEANLFTIFYVVLVAVPVAAAPFIR